MTLNTCPEESRLNHEPPPTIGLRFQLMGSKFEVTYISHGMIRYAATSGGKVFRLPYAEFIELQSQGKVEVDKSFNSRFLDPESASEFRRRRRYVEAACQRLLHPTKLADLEPLIREISTQLGEAAPSPKTVCRWIRAFRIESEAGLTSKQRRKGNRTLRFSPDIETLLAEAINSLYLKPEPFSAVDVRSYTVGQAMELYPNSIQRLDLMLPSLRTIQRRIQELDPYIVARAQKGQLAADRLARAAGKSFSSFAPLALVQIDTNTLDVLAVDPDTGEVLGRPYLVCALDVRTRAIVGRYFSMYPPSAVTTLAALKDMLTRPSRGLPGGIPSQIVPDNGVEFKNSSFSRVCQSLAITITPAQSKDPNGKAHVESFFRSLTKGIVQKLPGTTFSSPAHRGNYDSGKAAVLTLEKISELVDQWIEEVYHTTVHTRTKRAPIMAWNDELGRMPPLNLTTADVDAVVRRPELRSIRGGRVVNNYIEYYSHALAALEAITNNPVTILVNDLDLHTVLVQHPHKQDVLILAESVDPEYTLGLTSYEHEEVKKIKNEMAEEDLRRLGTKANLLARWKLIERIQHDTKAAKTWIRKLTNGRGRKSSDQHGDKLGANESPALIIEKTDSSSCSATGSDLKPTSPEDPTEVEGGYECVIL